MRKAFGIFVLAFVFAGFLSFTSFAAVRDPANYAVEYARPAIDVNCGYIDICRGKGDLVSSVLTYWWVVQPYNGQSGSFVRVDLNDSSIKFTGSGASLSVFYYSGGKLYPLSSSGLVAYDTFSGGVLGYNVYGNVGEMVTRGLSDLVPFSVQYSDSVSADQVAQIIAALQQSAQEQAQNGLDAEQDRSQTAADNSVSKGNSAISDNSASVTSGLSAFVQGLSYNGTACVWTMPRVYIPSISGVIGETTLVPEQLINFGDWLDALPSGVLVVVRSICSVAVIIFGFKEFYALIEYVLTLRGRGGDDE